MKAVLLAGGLGTRISEETIHKPKPMVEIGGLPIIWHVMKIYSYYGINDFIICCGYKGFMIKEYFSNYFLHTSDVTFDFKTNTQNVSDYEVQLTHYEQALTDYFKVPVAAVYIYNPLTDDLYNKSFEKVNFAINL